MSSRSPFSSPSSAPPPSAQPGRFAFQPAVIVSALVLVMGLGGVCWLAKSDAARARARAGTHARACAATLEAQFTQAFTALDILGALVRQNGGAMPNFQQVAAELLAARPGVVSLELQPGGIVQDIVPRVGNERALGFNVLADPAQRASAYAAIQSRGPIAVAGPLPFRASESGIVARLPIFLRGRDSRESFWGFVGMSMRFAEAASWTRFEALIAGRYEYCFYIPALAGQNPRITDTRGKASIQPYPPDAAPIAKVIAGLGDMALKDAFHQPVRVKNAELRLALRPHGGWFNKTKAGLEALGVVLVSGLLGLLVHTVSRGRALELALAEASCRLVRETEDKKRAEEEYRGAREGTTAAETALMQARFTLQQAESKSVKLQAQLEAEARGAQETSDALQAKLAQAELAASEWQTRLEAAARTAEASAQAKETELKQAQAALQPTRRTIQELETRLEMAAQAAAQAAQAKEAELDRTQAELRQARQSMKELETRLESAMLTQKQVIAEAQTRFEQDQATIAGLQASRAAAARSADETTEAREVTEFTLVHEEEIPDAAAEETAAEMVAEAESAAIDSNDDTSMSAEIPLDIFYGPPQLSIEESSPPSPAPPEPPQDTAEPVEEAPAQQKPAKTARRKKNPRDNQMDLFGAPTGAEPASTEPAMDAAATVPVIEALELPLDELAAPSVSPTPEPEIEPEPLAVAGFEETAGQPEFPDLAPPEAEFDDLMSAEAEDSHPAEETAFVTEEAKSAPARSLRPSPPVNPAQLRKAVNLMLPLLAGQDPGAKDCFKDNRASFRCAFTPEGFNEFEQMVKTGEFGAALEHLKKAARKHGISVAY